MEIYQIFVAILVVIAILFVVLKVRKANGTDPGVGGNRNEDRRSNHK